jgi:hypothetical protein
MISSKIKGDEPETAPEEEGKCSVVKEQKKRLRIHCQQAETHFHGLA